MDGFLDLGDHFGCMARRPQPVQTGHAAGPVYLDIEHADGVQYGGHFAFVNAFGIEAIKMAGAVLAVGARRGCS